MSIFNPILKGAVEVGLLRYWLKPMWAVLRHPCNTAEWYQQITTREWDEYKYIPGVPALTRHYLKKIGKR